MRMRADYATFSDTPLQIQTAIDMDVSWRKIVMPANLALIKHLLAVALERRRRPTNVKSRGRYNDKSQYACEWRYRHAAEFVCAYAAVVDAANCKALGEVKGISDHVLDSVKEFFKSKQHFE